MGEQDQEFGIGLNYYWGVIKRQRWVVALSVIVGILAAAGAYLLIEPTYTATTKVQISPLGEDRVAISQNPAQLIDHTFETALVTSDQTLLGAASELGQGSADKIRQSVDASLSKDSSVISINFTGPSKTEAIAGSSAVARSYLSERENIIIETVENRLEKLDAELASLATVKDSQMQQSALYAQKLEILAVDTQGGHLLNEPYAETIERSPDLKILAASGAALGFLAGLIVAVVRNRRNPKFQEPSDIEGAAHAPVLSDLGTVELALPLAQDAMVNLSIARERILAENRSGIMAVVGSGSLLTDSVTAARSHQVKVPVELAIALAISMSQAVSGVRLAIVGCDARELVRITRHLSLYQDPHDPDLLLTHHAPDLSVATFTYQPDQENTAVFTRAVVRELQSDATHTIVALGPHADPSDWTTAVRLANHGVVVVDPQRSSKEELARTTQMMDDLRTPCSGVLTVEEFRLPSAAPMRRTSSAHASARAAV